MNEPRANEILDKHLGMLAEHFDSVQIMATGLDTKGDTDVFFRGTGNWYARQGMAQSFINHNKARENAMELKSSQNDET